MSNSRYNAQEESLYFAHFLAATKIGNTHFAREEWLQSGINNGWRVQVGLISVCELYRVLLSLLGGKVLEKVQIRGTLKQSLMQIQDRLLIGINSRLPEEKSWS